MPRTIESGGAWRAKVAAAIFGLLLVLLAAGPARAEKLGDVIKNLYGGDRKITLLVDGGPLHQGDFDFAAPLRELGQIRSTLKGIASNLPVDASSASFSYELNQETGVIERVQTEGLGPYSIERASTLGQGRFSTNFVWTHADFHYLEGRSFDHLSYRAPLKPVPGDNSSFESDYLRVDVDVSKASLDIFGFFFSFGLLDELDITAVVPLIYVQLDVDANATLVDDGRGVHSFDPTPGRIVYPNTSPTDAANDSGGGSSFGFGDVLVRLKWKPLETIFGKDPPTSKYFEFALQPQIRFPVGDPDELTGSGDKERIFGIFPQTRLLGIFSKTFDGWFEPQINIGWKWSSSGTGHTLLYGVGASIKISDELTVFGGLNGRRDERLPKSAGVTPYDFQDSVWGFKLNPWQNLIVGANFIVPVNKQGVRADVMYSFGIEYVW